MEGIETTTVGGMVQLLAARYLPNGYRYYVSGLVPERKDPRAVDQKIMMKYAIAENRWARYRRKREGQVNLRYLRHGRRFLILATGPHGAHPFFEQELAVRDVEAVPIRFDGYELSFRGGQVWVRIDRKAFREFRQRVLGNALKKEVSALINEFRSLPYEPYRSVRYQMFRLLDEVNQRRKAAGLPRVPDWVVPSRRKSRRVFERQESLPGTALK